jgi:maltokinase
LTASPPPIDTSELEKLLAPFLERQEWYRAAVGDSSATRAALELEQAELVFAGPPALTRVVLGAGGQRLQLLIGSRDPVAAAAVLRGGESELIGSAHMAGEPVLLYDGLADDELLLTLLGVVTGGGREALTAERVRIVESLTSHAAVVYDDRLFMKLYRVLEPFPRPEVEMSFALDAVGFNHLVPPVAVWREAGLDLAFVREFIADAIEGRALALTSLRDLLNPAPGSSAASALEVAVAAAASSPAVADEAAEVVVAEAGGDIGEEMRRLGTMTARMHVALAEAFGWHRLASGEGVVHLHGDYHLRRVMRTEIGWLVTGFGDDPSRGSSLAAPGDKGGGAVREGSPLEDIADLCFSCHRIADEAVEHQHGADPAVSRLLAAAWERRNRAAFLSGYLGDPDLVELLGVDDGEISGRIDQLEAARAARGQQPGPGW